MVALEFARFFGLPAPRSANLTPGKTTALSQLGRAQELAARKRHPRRPAPSGRSSAPAGR